MANLRVKYMGLELKSPVVVGANDMVTSVDNLRKIEAAGAGAIVYKTLFEEQVQLESLELEERKTEYTERHAEMITLYPEISSDSNGIANHVLALKEAKHVLSIPLIASINAINIETWVDYAKRIETTGVDGIELNFYTSPEKSYNGLTDVESKQIQIFTAVKSAVSLPVAIKLSPFYSNPLKLISDLDKAGADAFVLFNKLFQPDIDIRSEEHIYPYSLSNKEDSRLPLRFAGMLYGNTRGSVCTSSGIISGADVVKMLLAGADAVQVVSSLYLNQIEVISKMLAFANSWMDEKGYRDIESFRGKLSEKRSENHPYHRVQYMDFMLTTSEILKKYKAIN